MEIGGSWVFAVFHIFFGYHAFNSEAYRENLCTINKYERMDLKMTINELVTADVCDT